MIIDWHIICVVLMFIIVDIVTGILKALKDKNLDSKTMRNGLFHKSTYFLAIILGCICEYGMNYLDLGFKIPMVNGICVYICLTEVMSILENLGQLNEELTNNKFMEIFASTNNPKERK